MLLNARKPVSIFLAKLYYPFSMLTFFGSEAMIETAYSVVLLILLYGYSKTIDFDIGFELTFFFKFLHTLIIHSGDVGLQENSEL